MKKCTLRLAAAILIMAALLFSQVFTAFAGWDDPFICVTKDLIDGKYVFRVKRVMNSATGILNSSTDITFTYKITCENDAYEVLKVVEGQSGIPAGINDVTIDVAELVEEMRAELPKYKSITIECNLRNVKGATLGTIDQIILNNTSGMSEEDAKAWLEALSEMFENMEEKSGKADIADDGANTLQTGATDFKGASSWAQAELEKAAGCGFITDRIKDNMSAPITREEFAEVAVKLYEKYTGKQAVTGDMSAFTDTSNPEVFKAYNLKIVNGTDVTRKLFSPNGQVNRQQVAVMLFRTISAMKPDADLGTSGAGTFADEKDIAPWAIEAVRFMNKNGFLKGSDNKIDPDGICTREMAVIIAVRVYEKYLDKEAASEEAVSSEPAGKAEDKGVELPANFPGVVPIIPDAVINTAEGFEGDRSGVLIYFTNYSVDEAIEFYSNMSLYKGLKSIMPIESDGSKSIQIDTQDYILLVSASDALQSAAGKTTITITIFETGLS